jgi:small subunit ribosomal protein S21
MSPVFRHLVKTALARPKFLTRSLASYGLCSLLLLIRSPIAGLSGRANDDFVSVDATSIGGRTNLNNQRNGINVQVLVRDNNVDQALRALKKKMQREGIFREMKMHDFYEKPSQKRAREKAESVRRVRKLARKKALRESGVVSAARGR